MQFQRRNVNSTIIILREQLNFEMTDFFKPICLLPAKSSLVLSNPFMRYLKKSIAYSFFSFDYITLFAISCRSLVCLIFVKTHSKTHCHFAVSSGSIPIFFYKNFESSRKLFFKLYNSFIPIIQLFFPCQLHFVASR